MQESRWPHWQCRCWAKGLLGFSALVSYLFIVWATPWSGDAFRAGGCFLVLVSAWFGGALAVLFTAVSIYALNTLGDAALPEPHILNTPGYLALWLTALVLALVLSCLRFGSKPDLASQAQALPAEAENQLGELESSYRLLFEENPLPMFICDAETLQFVAVNRAASASYGYQINEFSGMTFHDILGPPAQGDLENEARRPFQFERAGFQKQRMKDGTVIDVELRTREVTFRGRRARLALAIDATDRLRAQREMEHLATHDCLTGLLNRAALRCQIEQGITQARRNHDSLALLLIDLDRFKDINDCMGHHYGDVVLGIIGQRFLKMARESDVIARLGGDEFALCLPASSGSGAIEVAERILASLREPLQLEDQTILLEASIGISLYPDHGEDPDALLRVADIAMYAAKQAGGGFTIYAPDRHQICTRRFALAAELRRGLESDQLLLYYQPKVDLETMRVLSGEALVRWRHPRDGLITASQFIPLAEDSGLIKPLSLWVLNTALVQSRVWHRSGINLDVSVNMPASSLQDPTLISALQGLLEHTDSVPFWLTIEISETTMLDDPHLAMGICNQLRALGVRISIDNIGVAHSSLSILKDFPVDEVEIDRSFVSGAAKSPECLAIVQSIIELSHKLGVRVVAKGIETQEVLELVTSLGCDSGQGFLLGRPLCPGEFTSWVSQYGNRVSAGMCDRVFEARREAVMPG